MSQVFIPSSEGKGYSDTPRSTLLCWVEPKRGELGTSHATRHGRKHSLPTQNDTTDGARECCRLYAGRMGGLSCSACSPSDSINDAYCSVGVCGLLRRFCTFSRGSALGYADLPSYFLLSSESGVERFFFVWPLATWSCFPCRAVAFFRFTWTLPIHDILRYCVPASQISLSI